MAPRITNIMSKFVLFVALITLTFGCKTSKNPTSTPVPPEPTTVPVPKTSMVIVSHVGEVTKEVRCVGEAIKYRVYYENTAAQSTAFSISDPVIRYLSSSDCA